MSIPIQTTIEKGGVLNAPTQTTPKKRITVDLVLASLRASKGMVSIAARRAGCDRSTIYEYIKKYPSVAAALADERETMTDTAELALYSAIQDKEAWAVCFYLKTQGKGRGYVERQELTGPNGAPIEMTVREVIVRLNDQPL